MRRSMVGRSAPRVLRRLIWIAAVAVVACVPPGPRPGPERGDDIGVLATAGSQVFVNGRLAAAGTAIRNGDTVSTGAASSALVDFRSGGEVALAPDTDPSLRQFWYATQCVIEIVAGSGELYADTDPCDCVFRSPEVETACGSKFAAKVEPGRTTIILIAGHMSVRAPVATELQPFEQIVMTRSAIVDRRVLDKSEVRAAIAWRSQYKYDYGRTKQDQQGIKVPSLQKYTIRDALALTRKLGLQLQVMSQADSMRIIINQDPPPGTILPRGGTVSVWTESVVE
jgi:hypothetical protein